MELLALMIFFILTIIGMWKVFDKAGRPGWAAAVPVYNLIVLAEITGKPAVWAILALFPCAGYVLFLILCTELAKRFDKDVGYGIILGVFAPIMFPILGFGDAQYIPIGTEPKVTGTMPQM